MPFNNSNVFIITCQETNMRQAPYYVALMKYFCRQRKMDVYTIKLPQSVIKDQFAERRSLLDRIIEQLPTDTLTRNILAGHGLAGTQALLAGLRFNHNSPDAKLDSIISFLPDFSMRSFFRSDEKNDNKKFMNKKRSKIIYFDKSSNFSSLKAKSEIRN